MKYLKKFTESLDFESEVQEFCESGLAYLIDDGLIIKIINYRNLHYGDGWDNNYFQGSLLIDLSFRSEPRYWSDIKDQIIPFLQRLKRNYSIVSDNTEKETQIKFYTTSSFSLGYKIDDVINSKNLAPGFTFGYFKIDCIRIAINADKPTKPKKPMNRIQKFLYKVGSL